MAVTDRTLTNKEPSYVIYDDNIVGLSESGDTVITITSEWIDRTFQQTGSFPVQKYFNGAQISMTTTIAEILHPDTANINPNWLRVFPWATEVETGDPFQALVFSRGAVDPLSGQHIGQKGTDLAVTWKVVPHDTVNSYQTTPVETDRDFTIFEGLCTNVDGISFGNEAQVFSITVEGIYNPEVVSPNEVSHFAAYGQVTGGWTDV